MKEEEADDSSGKRWEARRREGNHRFKLQRKVGGNKDSPPNLLLHPPFHPFSILPQGEALTESHHPEN